MKGLIKCEKGHLYPARFDKCPHCHEDAKSSVVPLTKEQVKTAVANSLARGDLDESQIK